MKKISKEKEISITYYLNNGLSIRKIADICNVSKSLVGEIKLKIPNIPNLSPGGRTPMFTLYLERYCIRTITNSNNISTREVAQQIGTEFGVSVNRMTVSRALQKNGLKSNEKQVKPKLSSKNIKEHLSFANTHKD